MRHINHVSHILKVDIVVAAHEALPGEDAAVALRERGGEDRPGGSAAVLRRVDGGREARRDRKLDLELAGELVACGDAR